MTRMTSGLLGSRELKGAIEMIKPKTHFEQVPLEIVRKLIEEETQQEETTALTQETKQKNGKKDGKR